MGWLSKLLGKQAAPQESNAAENLSYTILKDAVTFKTEATNWIRSQQNTPLGTLMWFALPCGKNQYYQPCFGVYADPALFAKLDRAQSFNIAIGPTDSPSAFQWKIVVADPDNPGKSLSLVTVPLPIDETSVAKLQFLSEQARVYYLFYASNQASNFVWIEMYPEFSQQLRAFYLSLKKASTGAGSRTSQDQASNMQVGAVQIGQDSIALADGTVIALSDIKEISAPQIVVGQPNNLLTRAIDDELKKGHGIVYILYVTKDGASTKIIPTVDRSAAVTLAERLKNAKASGNRQVSDRIVVGECIKCHRKLRVRAHAVKPEMVLTCKCGQQNRVYTNEGPTK